MKLNKNETRTDKGVSHLSMELLERHNNGGGDKNYLRFDPYGGPRL